MSTRTGFRLCATAIAVFVLALGLTAYLGASSSDGGSAGAVTSTEPLSTAAEDVYAGLSDADVTAAQIFLSGAQGQPGALQRYNADMQRVSAGLAAIGAQADSSPVLRAAAGRILADLPEYEFVSGTAQADARQDLPVGAAYLREASGLMRSAMLPAAQQMLQVLTTRLDADDAAAGSGPIAQIVLGAIALAVLVVVQISIKRRTRRILNPGIAVATLLVVSLCAWCATSAGAAAGAASAARGHRLVANALIATDLTVLQAHDDELLSLAARGEDNGSYELDFQAAAGRLGTQLRADSGSESGSGSDSSVADASAAYRSWMTDHAVLVWLETAPQGSNAANVQAMAEVTGTQPGTGVLFTRVDDDLHSAAAAAQSAYLSAIEAARSDLDGLANGTALLALAALASGAYGINRRLREYR